MIEARPLRSLQVLATAVLVSTLLSQLLPTGTGPAHQHNDAAAAVTAAGSWLGDAVGSVSSSVARASADAVDEAIEMSAGGLRQARSATGALARLMGLSSLHRRLQARPTSSRGDARSSGRQPRRSGEGAQPGRLVRPLAVGGAAFAASAAAGPASAEVGPAINPAAVSTFAGSGTAATTDGTGTSASFTQMGGTAVVGGFAYQATRGAIRKVNLSTGQVTTLAGHPTLAGCVDSTDPTQVRFSTAKDLATDGTYLYVIGADCSPESVRRVSIATGATSTVATTIPSPTHLTFAGGSLYVSGTTNPQRVPGSRLQARPHHRGQLHLRHPARPGPDQQHG